MSTELFVCDTADALSAADAVLSPAGSACAENADVPDLSVPMGTEAPHLEPADFERVPAAAASPDADPVQLRRTVRVPVVSITVLACLILGCLFCELIMTHDPSYMDLMHYSTAPNSEFWFGTDMMGRDIFSMIWYGGRISLFIGLTAAAISTFIAVVYGTVSGLAPRWVDLIMMRLTEILMSVPSLLIIIFIQAMLRDPSPVTIAVVIGITSWMTMAKIVRTEVRKLRTADYVTAARTMGAGFWHILRVHIAPALVSSLMFMVVMNVRTAIVDESTLSFMGIGLPLSIISWGSMLSLSDKALLSGAWWIILTPGVFLVITLICLTAVGNWLRRGVNRRQSNL
ncbi:MAG: ABC transporter permease [Eubacteriaceae bacterium]|jgi:peptide/nickel transport system permease protein